MLYRISTEDVNRPEVERIVSKHFDGFTILPAAGYWKGGKERSLIIEISVPDSNNHITSRSRVYLVATEIKSANHQQSVMIQRIEDNQYFI